MRKESLARGCPFSHYTSSKSITRQGRNTSLRRTTHLKHLWHNLLGVVDEFLGHVYLILFRCLVSAGIFYEASDAVLVSIVDFAFNISREVRVALSLSLPFVDVATAVVLPSAVSHVESSSELPTAYRGSCNSSS